MLSTNEIRVGTAFMYEGAPFIVQRMLGQKSGRGGMVTRLRVKNIVTGSTQEEIHVEICSKCHSFYTGQQKAIKARGRIDMFNKKYGVQAN